MVASLRACGVSDVTDELLAAEVACCSCCHDRLITACNTRQSTESRRTTHANHSTYCLKTQQWWHAVRVPTM